jgi:cytochrome c biogenesis protein CcmG, thiol:disulfide interchange protein DsbE
MKLKRLRILVPGVVIVILGVMVFTMAQAAVDKGQKAPAFKLQATTGRYMTLGDVLGHNKVLVIDFWATWCPSCREETGVLQKLYVKYGGKGVAVAGVALDSAGIDDVKPFVKEHKLSYTMLTDPENKVSAPMYGVRGIPDTFIIDRNGVVRYHYVGVSPGMAKDIEQDIKTLLR